MMDSDVPTSSIYAGAMLRSREGQRPVEKRASTLGDLAQIVRDLLGSRDLIYQLTLRDLRIRYKQAAFGFAWALLIPAAVVMAGVAVRFAMSNMSGDPFNRHQAAAMALKAIPWAFFVGCLSTATPSLLSNIVLVTKVYFPREVLPLASVLAQTFDSTIGACLIAVLFVVFRINMTITMLWIPVLVVMLWTFALAAGLFLSCANIFFRDVKYLVQVFLTFGIFVTPVFLDAPMFGEKGARILMLNPLAPILEGLRLSVIEGQNLLVPVPREFWHPWYLGYSAAWAFGGLVLAALFFHRSERRFAELA